MPKIKIRSKEKEPETVVIVETGSEWDKALTHRDDVINYLMSFRGEIGFNPFLVVRKEIDPLNRRYAEGERSDELLKSFFALKKTPPSIE